jgi:hypothetical protein
VDTNASINDTYAPYATSAHLSGTSISDLVNIGSGSYQNTVWTTGTNGARIRSDTNSAGRLSLQGDNADIDINGVSLMENLRGIQDQLNILAPDAEMEADWDELRDIRQQYEAKLAECREKSKMWKALKS